MKLPQCLGLFRWSSVAAAIGLMAAAAPTVNAELFAYEGFDNPNLSGVPVAAPDGTRMSILGTSGTGFSAWTKTNGDETTTVYNTSGLAYPTSYPGSFSAVGGSGYNAGTAGSNSMYRLDFTSETATAVNSASKVYISFLGVRTGATTPDTGVTGTQPAGTYQNPYPRNAGLRLPNTTSGNNSMGLIGGNGNAAENNGWGAWGFKDTNGVMSGADIAGATDFVVVELDMEASMVSFWVNPQMDGTSDGYVSFLYTDGGNPVNMDLYGIGVEAGSGSGDRAPGEWAFDELRVGSTWEDVAGFSVSGPAVPEPSTYAAMAGVLALGFVAYRRRRNA